MKKVVAFILVLILAAALTGCYGNRDRSLFETKQSFTWAIIQLGNGELLEGEVTSWRDFSESDVVQFTMNGITYLTHYSKVILTSEKP